MPDELNPVVETKLGEKTYHLRCSLMAMRLFREMHGIDIFRDGIDLTKIEDHQFGDLFWCCLIKEEREKVPKEDIQELIDRKNYFNIAVAISTAIAMSFPKTEKKQKGETKDKSPLAKTPQAG